MLNSIILALMTPGKMSNKKHLCRTLKLKRALETTILKKFDEDGMPLTFDPWNQLSFRGSGGARCTFLKATTVFLPITMDF